jgi:ribonucleoside-diphosphate reductase alpha chain
LHDFIKANVHEPYVIEQVEPIFKDYNANKQQAKANDGINIPFESDTTEKSPSLSKTKSELFVNSLSITENDKEACPVCKNYLIITEGCNMCIECGFSSCGSG